MNFDFKRRLNGLQERMRKLNIDLVVFGSCQNFQYLTGLTEGWIFNWRSGIDLGSAVSNFFVGKHHDPILTLPKQYAERTVNTDTWIKDVRILEDGEIFGYHYGENYGKLVRKVLSDLEITDEASVGLGEHVWGSTVSEIALVAKHAKYSAARGLLDHVRMIKDEGEIAALRKVAKLTDQVMERVLPKIKNGVTQPEIELEAELQGRLLGASDVSFPPIVRFIRHGSEPWPVPITYPREEGLVSGSSIAFDIGFVRDGYCSDLGRSFYYGFPDAEIREGYEALHASVLETVDKIRTDNTRACDLFPIAETYLDQQGFGKYLPAYLPKTLGHGIGVEVHERPCLTPAYEDALCTNMVLAVEPRLWSPGKYYVRVEDMVLVGPRKSEFLTNFDRQIFVLS